MAKNTWGIILALGGLGIAAYFVWKYFTGQQGNYPTGGGTTTYTTTTTEYVTLPGGYQVSVPNIPIPPGGFIQYTPEQIKDIHNAAGTTQRWTGVSFGDPGQPSQAFKTNTLAAGQTVKGIGTVAKAVTVQTPKATISIAKPLAIIKKTPVVTVKPTSVAQQRTIIAAAAIKANAPPRVVAKIKGGSYY